MPPRTVILADEAYHHYASAPAYASLVDLVPAHPNLVVTRTFSKIFGMAGLRCGYAVSGEDTARRLAAHQGWSSVCALTCRRRAGQPRRPPPRRRAPRAQPGHARDRAQEVERLGFTVLPSEANFVMIAMGREVGPVIGALRDRGILPGRRFPALPTHLRVTIGAPEEMRRFLAAFRQVVAA